MRTIPTAAVLALVLCACDKKSDPGQAGAGADPPAAPRAHSERREREARAEDEKAEAKRALRQAYESATAEADPATREKAIAAVAWDGIDVDPELAREAFEALTPGSAEARRLVGHFAMRLADDDPDAALDWARSLESPEERADAIARIAVVLAGSDPGRAASLTVEEVPEGLPRDRAMVQVVQRWVQAAPAEAADWVATFPEGRARRGAVHSLATAWLPADPAGFQSWALRDPSLTADAAAAVAGTLRAIPDAATRAGRLDALTDASFRQHVEERLKESPPSGLPPLPPPGREPKR